MNGDFDPNGHKNLELFRYYLNRDLQKIDSSIQDNRGELKGYFIASLVDILVVFLFSENWIDFGKKWIDEEILIKLITIVVLIVLFIGVSWISNKILQYWHLKRKESGREEYIVDEAKQRMIDGFDNIACDGLLICESYMERYGLTEKPYVKEFYFYEIIHHLTKSTDLFEEIYGHIDLYVSSKEIELIDTYRVNNYIDFTKKINDFLRSEMKEFTKDDEVKRDIDNLDAVVAKWKHIDGLGNKIECNESKLVSEEGVHIMEEVEKFLKEAETYYLATIKGDQPRVRPFGTAHIFEGKLYIQTSKKKDVSKQLHANPKAELCAFKGGEWIRVAGELVEDDRVEARQSMLDAYPGLKKMYAADDGNTEVFYFKNGVATISSFTYEPKVIKF